MTVEGKVDVTLIGISRYDATDKKAVKEFLTNENEQYSSAKSPVGMFDRQLIPNDLGLVAQNIMLVSTAFFLGLLLGGFILVVVLILQFYGKKTTKECPVCKEVRELQEKEEEALRKEWKDQQTGYKN